MARLRCLYWRYVDCTLSTRLSFLPSLMVPSCRLSSSPRGILPSTQYFYFGTSIVGPALAPGFPDKGSAISDQRSGTTAAEATPFPPNSYPTSSRGDADTEHARCGCVGKTNSNIAEGSVQSISPTASSSQVDAIAGAPSYPPVLPATYKWTCACVTHDNRDVFDTRLSASLTRATLLHSTGWPHGERTILDGPFRSLVAAFDSTRVFLPYTSCSGAETATSNRCLMWNTSRLLTTSSPHADSR